MQADCRELSEWVRSTVSSRTSLTRKLYPQTCDLDTSVACLLFHVFSDASLAGMRSPVCFCTCQRSRWVARESLRIGSSLANVMQFSHAHGSFILHGLLYAALGMCTLFILVQKHHLSLSRIMNSERLLRRQEPWSILKENGLPLVHSMNHFLVIGRSSS